MVSSVLAAPATPPQAKVLAQIAYDDARSSVEGVAVSDSGRWIAVVFRGARAVDTLTVWKISNGKLTLFKKQVLLGNPDLFNDDLSMFFDGDSRLFVASDSRDKSVSPRALIDVVDLASGEVLQGLPFAGFPGSEIIMSWAPSRDGKFLAVLSMTPAAYKDELGQMSLRSFELRTGKQVGKTQSLKPGWRGHAGALSDDGTNLIFGLSSWAFLVSVETGLDESKTRL